MTTAEHVTEDDVRQKWGQAIRLQRRARKMTQVQLAEAVGVDQTTVSSWEKGRKAPGVDRQLVIARVLGVDARVLFAFPDAA